MMGTKVRRFGPLEHVTLENLVPKDHFYRQVERTLDLSFVRDMVKSCYAVGGRQCLSSLGLSPCCVSSRISG